MLYKKISAYVFRPSLSLAIVFLVSIGIAVSTWYITKVDPLHTRDAEKGVASLGTEVRSDIMSLKVEGVRQDNVGSMPFVPREGYTFIIPTLIISNLSNTERALIPTLTLYIKDRDNNIYTMAVAPLDTETFGGAMLPHDTVRQEMAFEVQKDAKDLVLYFETGGKVMAERLTR